MNKQKTISTLHFITHPTEHSCPSEQAALVLEGGCNWIQLRMKNHPEEQIRTEARKINTLRSQFDFALIINDHPKLALECGADGVHLGKQDCSPLEARKILGDDFIIGGTANTMDDIQRLTDQNVDYIGLGPFRFTSTKENLSPILGVNGYMQILNEMRVRNISVPVIGIGGVLLNDLPELLETGLHGIATSSSLLNTSSVAETTENWLKSIQKYASPAAATQLK